MRRLALAVALAACGPARPDPQPVVTAPPPPPDAALAPPTPDADPDAPRIDWSVVPADDAAALAVWDQLDITGDTWQQRLSFVPGDARALRVALAKSFLRQGNFACPSVARQVNCVQTVREFQPLAPDARLDDPCLRREIAAWAIGELDAETLTTELAADVIAIAGLPDPENLLNTRVLERVSDEALELQMLDAVERAGNQEVADESLGGLSAAGLETAALALNIDGAVEALAPEGALPLFLAALTDDGLRTATRLGVVRELAGYAASLGPTDEPDRTTVIEALQDASTRVASCEVAGVAEAAWLALTGRPTPAGLATGKQARVRELCMRVASERTTGLVGKAGLVMRRHGPDGLEVEKQDAADFPDPDLATELRRALPHCQGDMCKVPETGVTLRLTFKVERKRSWLAGVERRDDGC